MGKLILADNSKHDLIVFDSFDHLARLTLRYIKTGNIAVSGGNTFKQLFTSWTKFASSSSDAVFFPVDERLVPITDPQSNWGMTIKTLLAPLRKKNDKRNFASSYELYQKLLHSHFQQDIPEFDVIFLGVGDDGHTASLFPGTFASEDTSSIILSTLSPNPPHERLTLGPCVLVKAKILITIIAGIQKKKIVKQIKKINKNLPIVSILLRRTHSLIFIEQNLMKEM